MSEQASSSIQGTAEYIVTTRRFTSDRDTKFKIQKFKNKYSRSPHVKQVPNDETAQLLEEKVKSKQYKTSIGRLTHSISRIIHGNLCLAY